MIIRKVFMVLMLFCGLVSCTKADQYFLQTQAVSLQKTALAQGESTVKTQVASLQRTAEAAAATEVSKLATQLAGVLKLPDRYLVGTYFYPWWGPSRNHWEDGYARHPSLGEYNSSDPLVIKQQIEWATQHGIDFFAASWWGPGSLEDNVLRDKILKNSASKLIRFSIVYESYGRLKISSDGSINLSDPTNRKLLLDDFEYIQKNYWNESQYLKIDNKPVVILYLSRIFTGDVRGAVNAVREACRKRGHEIYLVADEVYWLDARQIDINRLKVYEAITAYNMHTSVAGIATDFTKKVSVQYSNWAVAAQNAGVAFVPGVIPGFDDTSVRPESNHPPIPRSEALFRDQLNMAFEFLDPKINMLLVTSWNEWHEDTSIEPAKEFDLRYLDILQNRLSQ